MAAPYCAVQRFHRPVRRRAARCPGWKKAAAPSLATLRSTALISGLKCTALGSAAARRLAASTAAWAGVLRISSSQAPSSRISVAAPDLCGESGLARKPRSTALQRPEMAQRLAGQGAREARHRAAAAPSVAAASASSGLRLVSTRDSNASAAWRGG